VFSLVVASLTVKIAILILILLQLPSGLRAQGYGRVIYVSPDSKLRAVITIPRSDRKIVAIA